MNHPRRTFCRTAALGTMGLSLPVADKQMLVYIGTYTTGPAARSAGIYVYRLNLTTGELKPASTAQNTVNPSFLAVAPNRKFLYAVNEIGEFQGKKTGALSAFAIEQKTGALKPINQQSSQGASPCYVTVDRTGKYALTANYGGGSLAVLSINADGSLGAATDTVQHTGASVNPQRQKEPHAHCIVIDPANRFVFAADLGLDKVMCYRFDAATGKLTPNAPPFAAVKPGAGPRHFTLHPNGTHAFVINELDSTLTAFAYDQATGALQETHTVSTLPAGFTETSYCADLHVHPSGKFVYGSNRGHNSIVVFAFDKRAGKLSLLEHVSTQGNWPRNFALDPTGAFLLAANQRTDNLAVYRIDRQSGKLKPTGRLIEVPSPVCLKLMPAFV